MKWHLLIFTESLKKNNPFSMDMTINHITLCTDNAAVDAYILGKGHAVPVFAEQFRIPLHQMASIADGIKDLEFLETPCLGLIGAPANAQPQVKERVTARGSHVSTLETFAAFEEFYAMAGEQGMTHIISDRDGVLKEGKTSWGEQFKALTREMGTAGKPYVVVLTGSSLDQNLAFAKEYGLDATLGTNPAVQKHPYLLLVENGIIAYNVLTGATRNGVQSLNPEILAQLKGPFEEEVMRQLRETILPRFRLRESTVYDDQRGAVYVAPKEAMVSLNIPRDFADGRKDYRKSPEAQELRQAMLGIMKSAAERVRIAYHILE